MVGHRAGVAQWESEGLIIPRPWVRFPPPAPFHLPAFDEQTFEVVPGSTRAFERTFGVSLQFDAPLERP
jgi:hypothetical protein